MESSKANLVKPLDTLGAKRLPDAVECARVEAVCRRLRLQPRLDSVQRVSHNGDGDPSCRPSHHIAHQRHGGRLLLRGSLGNASVLLLLLLLLCCTRWC